MITKKLKLLLPLLAIAMMASCSWEKDMDLEPAGRGNEVVFSMRVPANYNITRALGEADEDEVRTLDVLVFDNSNGKLLSRSTNSGLPTSNGNEINFYVRLEKDDNVTDYDFILLANVRDIISSQLYTNGELTPNLDKEKVQQALKSSLEPGKGWISNRGDSGYKAMPMWGELNDQTIEPGKKYPSTKLTRATVKVDISVALETVGNSFEMMEVWYCHYNTKGYIIPLEENFSNGIATKPTLGDLSLHTASPIKYTDGFTSNGKKLVDTIYGFEAGEGSGSDPEYKNNPCLLVHGKFNDTEEGWYRLDFAHVDKNTMSPIYIPLLRNHQYNIIITAINGPGYPDPNEALNSKPGNVATEISVWEEGDNVGGVWNGNYEIKFSTLEANFTQFGEPSPQEVTITTNCSTLTFDNFKNISTGSGDGMWSESPAGTWSNGHFTVMTNPGTPGPDGKMDYTLMITSRETQSGDVDARESRFKIKGSNMEANFRITQDRHLEYRLITDPNHITPIVVDGSEQRIKINVSSTHNYSVTFNSLGTGIFQNEVYEDAIGGSPISDITDIPKNITTIYVQVNANATTNPRMGTLTIAHVEPASDAPLIIYNVLQVTPVIVATLTDGGYTGTVPGWGGNAAINVVSNTNEWVPVLKRRIGSAPEENLSSPADLLSYFGIENGSGSRVVTFTVPALTGTEDIVYTITFMDTNSSEVSNPPIIITQKYALPASGGGGTPPLGGVRAEEFILSVDAKGVLNLDGPKRNNNWLVYFKWGSTVAVSGGLTGELFNATKIAWTPEGYDYEMLMSGAWTETPANGWALIPYQSSGNVIIDDPTAGTGDPCKLAIKDGVVGGHRMPTGNQYEQFLLGGAWTTSNGSKGRWSYYGSPSQFYPAAGWLGSAGTVQNVGVNGYYWSSTSSNDKNAFSLNFNDNGTNPRDAGPRSVGATIRCVRDE